MKFKYFKIIICPSCNSKIELRIFNPNKYGFVKRKCNICNNKWRVSRNKAYNLNYI